MSNNAAAIIANAGQGAVTNNTAAVVSNTSQAAASAGTTDGSGPIIYIALIVLVAGLVSGIAAYLTQPVQNDPAQPPLPHTPWYTFCLLGLIAAACVPLFLSVVKSDIMTVILGGGAAMVGALLIFLGFCLLAAFTGRAFLDSLSRRILQQMENIRERQNQAAQERQEIREVAERADAKAEIVAEAVDEQNAPAAMELAAADMVPAADLPTVVDVERKIVQALGKKDYRTVSGVTEDSGLSRDEVKRRLQELALKGVATTTTSSTTGGVRWKLTPAGRSLLQP